MLRRGKDTAKTDFGLLTLKKGIQRKVKPRRRIKFEADGWYETATRSIAIANSERGPRISSQWITMSPEAVEDYD